MYLLDTNVVSELRRPRPHGGVLAWIGTVSDADLHVSAVTFGELQSGIEITRGRDPAKAAEIEAWVDEAARRFRTLGMDIRAFRCWAKLMRGRPDDHLMDAMIAAAAMTNNLIVVTRNVRDFEPFGVETFDPFSFRA